MYGGDNELIMTAYIEYENVRSPLTDLESILCDFKRSLIDHYEQLLIEKRAYNNEIGKAFLFPSIMLLKWMRPLKSLKGC